MSHLKKRGTAVAITVVLIILSILFGSHRSLARLYNRVADVFENGSSGNGYGIRYDLDARASYAYNMIAVAKRYLPENHLKITALETAADSLKNAKSVSEAYEADLALTDAASALYDILGGCPLSEADKGYRESIMTDLESSEYKISHSDYNDFARKYNETLKKFPASILRVITSVDKAELFGE